MSETICPDCGERNTGSVEFCTACGAFLAWDADADVPAGPEPVRVPPHTVSGPLAGQPVAGQSVAGQPAAGQPTGPAGSGSAQESRPVGQPAWRVAEALPEVHQTQPVARALSVGASTIGAAQRNPIQTAAREWGAAQLGGSAAQASTRSDRQDRLPPAEPTSLTAPPEPAEPTEGPCPRCGVVNDAALRFCRKCGLALKGPSLHDEPSRAEPTPERRPWWQRWFRPADNTRRAARSAFRHSLPLRYRLIRWVMGLLGIGAIIGALTLIGQNPVRWATDRINDLRGSLVQVEGLRAYDAPQDGAGQAPPNAAGQSAAGTPAAGTDTAENVLDNRYDTAWATTWSAANQLDPSAAPCVAPSTPSAAGTPGSILIVPSGPVTVREISVASGRAKADPRRPLEWRPKTIQLAFSDGSCQVITLEDSDVLQPMKIDPVETTQIRLSVVNAYQAGTDQPTAPAAISDIVLYQRP